MTGSTPIREKLSFSKAELAGTNEFIAMDRAGISLAASAPKAEADWKAYHASFTREKDWLNFGSIWGSLNTPQFHADATKENITPKKEDFVEAPFRLISATVVGAHSWKATDFSDEKVLKASVKKLDGKPLYKDHETDIDNWVGLVNGVKWDASFTDESGVKVPAGIDGMIAIDSKTNPKVARGVLMGSVFSNSVTVEFDWVPSHSFENVEDFYRQLGKYAADGKMVRRIVTVIHNYHESSLVWLGADPFAKMKTPDGNLKHIDVSSIEYAKAVGEDNIEYEQYETAEETEKKSYGDTKRYKVAFGFDKSLQYLTARYDKPTEIKDNTISMEKTIAMLKVLLGLTAEENLTDERAVELLGKSVVVDKSAFDADKAKITGYDQFVAKAKACLGKDADGKEIEFSEEFLTSHQFISSEKLSTMETQIGQLESLKADADLGKTYLAAQRAEAIRLYKLSVGENADEAVVGLFNKATSEELVGLLKQHGQALTVKYGASCTKCNSSENISYRSTISDGKEGQPTDDEAYAVSASEMYAQHSFRPLFPKAPVDKKD